MSNEQIAVFAGGCFWCTEPVFSQLKGVSKVVSGYIGGHTPDPTYKLICNGDTGHAEAIQITFESVYYMVSSTITKTAYHMVSL